LPARVHQHHGKIVEPRGHTHVIASQRFRSDLDRASIERLCFGVTARIEKKVGRIVEPLPYVGMIRAQELFAQRERLAKERLGSGISRAAVEEIRRGIEQSRQALAFHSYPLRLLPQFQRVRQQLRTAGPRIRVLV
jgi:hypothetical protein